jgi:hypothetical protein|nr:MAG TPA: hypothetical protein [Caudoviricetes sp.]
MSNKPKLPKIDIREDEIRQAKSTADSYGDIVNRVVDEVVESACSVLDEAIKEIQELLSLDTPPIADLNYFIGYLPTAMYFVSDRAEFVGIQMDSSSAIRREKYDELYALAAGKTIPDKEAETRKLVMNETVVEAAYKRAYRKVQSKLEQADKVLASLKRIQQWQLAELETTRNSGGITLNARNSRKGNRQET